MRPERQLGFLWGAVAVALVALAPVGPRLAAALPGCPFLAVTGLPCAGCGTARAALALARLEPLDAIVHNPLAALGWMALVGGGLVAGVVVLFGGAVPELRWTPPRALRLAAVAAVLANWAYLV